MADMDDLPVLTKDLIRQRANAQSWQRGLDYFHKGAVSHVVWRNGVLTAEVAGSQYEPYQVRVNFSDGDLISADCTCPYDWGGDCKHIVATLLYLVHHRQKIEQRPSLPDLLASLNREQLVDLVQALARVYPRLVEDVEDLVDALVSPGISTTSLPSVNLRAMQQQIRADLRAKGEELYSAYYEDYYEGDSTFGEVLEPAMEQVHMLLDAGDARGALAVLEAATVAWIEGCRRLDQDLLEELIELGDEYLADWGNLWAEALLLADLTPQERARWENTLSEWADSMAGGSELDIAVTAAQQGWDYPPLVAAMEGHITEKGAWEDEPPYFADELALIRLRVLEQRGRLEEYLNLAQAEGQFLLYLQMLIRLGRSELACAEARDYLSDSADILTVARALAERGEMERALELAAHGLALKSERGRAALAEWLRDQALACKRGDLALQAGWQALRDNVSLENYRWLREHLGEEWPFHRAEALRIVASSPSAGEAAEIYLYERMYREAMALADQESWYVDIDRVIEAVKGEFPEWAFEKCRRRAEEIMNAGKASHYDVAVDWLRRGRDILLAAGRQAEWNAYLQLLLETHQRKYKLLPMLKALDRW